MATPSLTAYWIIPPGRWGPLGIGVTAHSGDDALRIIRKAGDGDYLPDDRNQLRIHEDIKYAEIDEPYVREHMGPIVGRGLWYPLRRQHRLWGVT